MSNSKLVNVLFKIIDARLEHHGLLSEEPDDGSDGDDGEENPDDGEEDDGSSDGSDDPENGDDEEPSATIEFIDEFSSGLRRYHGQVDKFDIREDRRRIGCQSLYTGSSSNESIIRYGVGFEPGDRIRYDIYPRNAQLFEFNLGFEDSRNRLLTAFRSGSGGEFYMTEVVDGEWENVLHENASIPEDQWLTIEVLLGDDGEEVSMTIFDDEGSEVGSASGLVMADIDFSAGYSFAVGGNSGSERWVDALRIRHSN